MEASSSAAPANTNTWSNRLFPAAKRDDGSSKPSDTPLTLVGGTVLSYLNKGRKQRGDTESAVVGLIVCTFPGFDVVYDRVRVIETSEPYVPGYLSWREVDHLVQLVNELKETQPSLVPQVLVVGGNSVISVRGK